MALSHLYPWVLVLWEADRLGTVLQESTSDVDRRLSSQGWVLTCRMSGESRISTAITSEGAGLGCKTRSIPRLYVSVKCSMSSFWVHEGGGLKLSLLLQSHRLGSLFQIEIRTPSPIFSQAVP